MKDYIRFEMNPNKKSRPANIITTIIITKTIQIANFNKYQAIIAAIITTKIRIIHDSSINANNNFLHLPIAS